MKYHLIHITTSGEYATPLVASQLFDQAEIQATDKQPNYPLSVAAWIIIPMRDTYNKNVIQKISQLQLRCPNVSISLIGGINRVKDFPALQLMLVKRMALGYKTPVIYHCRGEQAALWARKMKKYFPNDKVIVDVRGYWPAELLYKRGIQDPNEARDRDAKDFEKASQVLGSVIKQADAVTTVSEELKILLVNKFNARNTTTVVPCCVKTIMDDTHRNEIRAMWKIREDEIGIVYSGTAAAYQHLEDLTLPFLYRLSKENAKIRVIILTPDIDVVKKMLNTYHFDRPVILENVQQGDVAKYLTATDVGILVRKPTVVNRVANPVKIAEYLASGLSIIAEDGVGGIPNSAFEKGVIKGIHISSGAMDDDIMNVGNWLKEEKFKNRSDARNIAKEKYYWNSAIQIHRNTYFNLLNGSHSENTW